MFCLGFLLSKQFILLGPVADTTKMENFSVTHDFPKSVVHFPLLCAVLF